MTSEPQTLPTASMRGSDQRTLLDLISDVVCIVDEHGMVRYANAAFDAILGGHEGRARHPLWLLVHPDEQGAFRSWLERHFRGIAGAETLEVRTRHRDGAWRTLEIRSHALQLGPTTRTLTLIARDLTEQRQLEAQLSRAQRLEAVGLLASGVAHDFNNLLTGIKGYADFLLRAPGLHEPHRHDVQEIGQAAQRAATLTRQLLAFSRHQEVEPQIIDPKAILTDLKEMVRRLVNENIEVEMVLPRHTGWISIDRGQFEQVVFNLAVNARDAMPAGGRLLFELDDVEIGQAATPPGVHLEPGTYVRIRVTDTGAGMDEQTRRRIFEPFFTTKGPESGTGLGLSNVQAIVRKSGGEVRVESTPGIGSSFELLLPQIRRPATVPGQTRAPLTTPPRHGSETVLLAEDDSVVRNLVLRVLTSRGYHVLTASDGDEARRIAAAFQGTIHLLVSDVVMPKLSGGELAEILLEKRPGLKVLLISGHAADTLGDEIANPRINFLAKPFTPDTLLHRVRELLDAKRSSTVA